MKTIPHPSQPAAPTIRNRQELEAVVENIVQLQLERASLEADQDREITAIRQKYRVPLAEIDRYLTLETTWAETWARSHPVAFSEQKSLECTHAVIGFRTSPPRVDRASRKWTWSAIAAKLGEASWGSRYLRIPAPEVNKEALLADRAVLRPDELKLAGLKIVQEERFYLTPHGSSDTAIDSTEWQEAA